MSDAQRDYRDWIFDNAHRIEEFNAMTRDAFAALVWDAARAALASPGEEQVTALVEAATRSVRLLKSLARIGAFPKEAPELVRLVDALAALRTTKEGEG